MKNGSANFIKQKLKSIPLLGAALTRCSQVFLGAWARQRTKRNARHFNAFRRHVSSLPLHQGSAIFVKVGANDGLTLDPCSDLLVADERWKGLLIEPVPFLFSRLQANFGDSSRFQLEQVAVGPAGEYPFYYVDESAKAEFPDLPGHFDQLGSFDKDHIAKHFGDLLAKHVRYVSIRAEPLNDILARHGIAECDLLHVDTEGFDFKVLSTLDFSMVKPKSIYVEHKHLSRSERRSLLKMLKAHSYEVRDCGGDYFALLKAATR